MKSKKRKRNHTYDSPSSSVIPIPNRKLGAVIRSI
jgi:hypothetical protein